MARYVGHADFTTLVELGWQAGRIVLTTDEGTLAVQKLMKDGSIISGTTEDGRLVTIDCNDPGHITVT